MKTDLRNKAVYLRVEKRMSYGQIKERLGVSKSTLSYWLSKYPLSKKEIFELRSKNWSKGEVSRELYRNTMREKKQALCQKIYRQKKKEMESVTSKELYLAGLMLYLGEGAKKKDSALVLANSDPQVIRFFIWWLHRFLGVSRNELRIQLHLYEDMDIPKEIAFWKKYLGIKKEQLYKPSIRKLKKNSFSYKNSHMHGTCSLYCFGVDRVREVMEGIRAMLDTYQ